MVRLVEPQAPLAQSSSISSSRCRAVRLAYILRIASIARRHQTNGVNKMMSTMSQPLSQHPYRASLAFNHILPDGPNGASIYR